MLTRSSENTVNVMQIFTKGLFFLSSDILYSFWDWKTDPKTHADPKHCMDKFVDFLNRKICLKLHRVESRTALTGI